MKRLILLIFLMGSLQGCIAMLVGNIAAKIEYENYVEKAERETPNNVMSYDQYFQSVSPTCNQRTSCVEEITQKTKKAEKVNNKVKVVEKVKEVETVKKVENIEEVAKVAKVETIKKPSFKSSEAVVKSTGVSKLVSSSQVEWTDAVVKVSAGMGDGGGFVISENLILTNHHVVGESKSVAIKFSNGLQLIGKVIASNMGRDVAVVKVDATLPKYFRASRTAPIVGSDVYAIDIPLDENPHFTVSQGIISAVRVVQNKILIQSNVDIPSGSSGSPLIDKSGTVIGIAVSQFATNKTSQGINFFIPIDDALKSLEVI